MAGGWLDSVLQDDSSAPRTTHWERIINMKNSVCILPDELNQWLWTFSFVLRPPSYCSKTVLSRGVHAQKPEKWIWVTAVINTQVVFGDEWPYMHHGVHVSSMCLVNESAETCRQAFAEAYEDRLCDLPTLIDVKNNTKLLPSWKWNPAGAKENFSLCSSCSWEKTRLRRLMIKKKDEVDVYVKR